MRNPLATLSADERALLRKRLRTPVLTFLALLALLASVLLLWINGAVGIIGSEDHPANLLYLAVVAAAFVGAVATRFRANGLSLVMVCAAALQAVIGVLAVLRGWGEGSENWPQAVVVLSTIFVLIWLGSAGSFRRAARAPAHR